MRLRKSKTLSYKERCYTVLDRLGSAREISGRYRTTLMKYSERDIEENWCLGRDIYITAPKEFPLDLRHYRKPDPT